MIPIPMHPAATSPAPAAMTTPPGRPHLLANSQKPKPINQKKRFKPAVEFFINELYGPNDFSQRDQDIARIVPKMSKFMPENL